MGKLSRVLRCNNCGEILQSNDKTKPGYIPKLDFTNETDRVLYCESCYQKKMVNRGFLAKEIDDDSYTILKKAAIERCLIVYVIDTFAFNGIIKSQLIELIKDLPILIVANKKDLFLEKDSDNTLKSFIYDRFKELNIVPKEIILVSANKNYQIDLVKTKIEEYRNQKDVYFIGERESGKTAIINCLLKNYKNNTTRNITSFLYPNTNSKLLTIPLDENTNLYELPGFNLDDSCLGLVEKNIANKYLSLKTPVKAKKIKLLEGQCLVFGGLAMIGLHQGKSLEFKAYFNDKIETKKMGLDKERVFFKTNLLKKDLRPVSDLLMDFDNYDLFQYKMENDNKLHEIAIKGLGFITFIAKGQIIYIMAPKGVGIKEGTPRVI